MNYVNAQSYLGQHLGKQNIVEVKLTLPTRPAAGKMHYCFMEELTALLPAGVWYENQVIEPYRVRGHLARNGFRGFLQ